MIVDIAELPDVPIKADICIVGSGAAGISIAREFLGTKTKVFIFEGGGSLFEEQSQEPYRSEVIGLAHGIHQGRARVIGGTTTLWAGQALPLFEEDFEERSWVPFSGWPLSLTDLLPFYRRAEKVMQIPESTYDSRACPNSNDPPDYDKSKLRVVCSQFAEEPNFSSKYRKDIAAAPNITLVTHANVVALEADENATRLKQLKIRSFKNKLLTASASYYVICCGGIETARLMLASRNVEPNGVGNQNDVVGRYFQDHVGVDVGVVKPLSNRFSGALDPFKTDGIAHSIRLSATKELQKQHKLLGVAGGIYYPILPDDPIQAAKNIVLALRTGKNKSEILKLLGQTLKGADKVAAAAFKFFVLKKSTTAGTVLPHCGLRCEQVPNPNSRVKLSESTDSLGVPRTVLDWQLTAAESRTLEIFLKLLSEEWRRLKIAEIDCDSCIISGREQGRHGGFVDASHHIGTTRMGTDPKFSVTNSKCRVHGYDNLFIGSSAVFPTGGFSNPTLTIIALCLRISDELKMKLGPS